MNSKKKKKKLNVEKFHNQAVMYTLKPVKLEFFFQRFKLKLEEKNLKKNKKKFHHYTITFTFFDFQMNKKKFQKKPSSFYIIPYSMMANSKKRSWNKKKTTAMKKISRIVKVNYHCTGKEKTWWSSPGLLLLNDKI